MNRDHESKTLSAPMRQHHMPTSREGADIVIIGNGIAGLTAAIEARRYDASKSIIVITDQLYTTINAPALKQFAVNRLRSEQLLAYPLGTEESLNINFINAHVEEIYAEDKYLGLAGNRTFGYGRLLIATGSLPGGLPTDVPGRVFNGVMTLHRLEDYQDLRRRLPEVRQAVVIGSGTHATEVVMILLHWGIRVHWLLRGKQLLSGILDSTASELALNKVRRAGALIYTETEIAAIVGQLASVTGVITNADERIPCQLVLCCTGTHPALGLARRCTVPMMFKDGILVDGRLRTSVPDIYAAGDVAALPNPQTGDYETRGQWYSAMTQGKIAGAMMVGRSEVDHELFGVPWHATQLGPLSMLTVGNPLAVGANGQMATIYTDTSRRGYRRLAVVEDRLVGYLSVGTTQADGLSIKRFIDDGLSISDIFKPLLKGKFDAHKYLTKAKVRPARTQLLAPLEELRAFQWPDTIGELRAMQWLETEQRLETPQWLETEQRLETPQDSEAEASWLLSSEHVIPVELQTSEIRLEMGIEQAIGVGAPYQLGRSPLNEANKPTSQFIKPRLIGYSKKGEDADATALSSGQSETSQFMKPGLIGYHKKGKDSDATALSYEQSKQDKVTGPLVGDITTDPLPAMVKEN
jgi:thioredoxin reductase